MYDFKDEELLELMLQCGYLTGKEEKKEVMQSEIKMFKKFADLVIKLQEQKHVGT